MPAAPASAAAAPADPVPARPTLRGRLRAARLRSRSGVTLGREAIVGRGVRADVARGARLEIGDEVALGAGTRLIVREGEIRIGAGSVLGGRCVLVAHAGIEVGRRCLLGDGVVIVDADPVFTDPERPTREQGLVSGRVALGDGARIGHGAALLRGVRIGPGAAVGAHAVVTADVPPGSVAGGVPARPRRLTSTR